MSSRPSKASILTLPLFWSINRFLNRNHIVISRYGSKIDERNGVRASGWRRNNASARAGVVTWSPPLWARRRRRRRVRAPRGTIRRAPQRAAAQPTWRMPWRKASEAVPAAVAAAAAVAAPGVPARLPPRSAPGPSRVSRPWVASRRHRRPP